MTRRQWRLEQNNIIGEATDKQGVVTQAGKTTA